jgi:hypothetical protein
MPDGWETLEHILIALFAAVPPTIASVAALVYALRAYRAAGIAASKLDGRLDQLVKAERGKARLEGTLEGQAEALMPRPPAEVWRHPTGDAPRGPRTDLPPPQPPAGRPG